jgi:hypothetical protein
VNNSSVCKVSHWFNSTGSVEESTVCNSKSCTAPVVQMNRPWINIEVPNNQCTRTLPVVLIHDVSSEGRALPPRAWQDREMVPNVALNKKVFLAPNSVSRWAVLMHALCWQQDNQQTA